MDERVSDMADKCIENLDTTLLFVSLFASLAHIMSQPGFSLYQAGLFSGTAATLLVQVFQSNQSNPVDVTNVLLLQILQQNSPFDGVDPLAPPIPPPRNAVAAECILFTCLAVTFAVAFLAVISKWLIYYYMQQLKWGGADDEGKNFRLWFLELGNQVLYYLLSFLGITQANMLGLFGIGFVLFLWDFNLASAVTVLAILCLTFSCFLVVLKLIVYIPRKSRPQAKAPSHSLGGVDSRLSPMTLSNPDFWRKEPLLTPSPPEDVVSSAGVWLLENSGDFSAASAVAAMFSEFQWPLRRPCTTVALVRLRGAYDRCLRAPKFDTSARLNALQSAAAYYVLYHTQLIREVMESPTTSEEKLPTDLPLDLLVHEHNEEWGREGMFEYLLRTEDRSELVTSARFLSYIATYWFCGDSDSSIQSRPSRLEKMHKLVDVLEKSEAFTRATITNCVLSVGAAMDFPLHPDDLVRVDKRCVRSSSRRWRN